MTKQQLNLRVSDLTRQQLEQLQKWWGTSQTETITVLIDRVYQAERPKQEWVSTFSEIQMETSK